VSEILNDMTRAALDSYVTELYAQEDDTLKWIQAEAERNEMPAISVRPFEGRLLQFLVYASGAMKVVEIGTLAGYSGTWIARALPAGGKLHTLERSDKHAGVAQASFQRAGVSDRVEIILGPALESLEKLSSKGPFDLVFIDANKDSYPEYLKWAVANLRPGGMVAAHNAFRSGAILTKETEDDRIMDEFNRSLANHPQLESTILAVGDGMAVGVKKR
jgi:caffeoyl-CoA O-methyltransferase